MKEVRMHKDPPASGSIAPWQRASTDRGPTEGNHRLTALTGSLLTPLLAAIFLTGLLMDALWHVHYVVGFALATTLRELRSRPWHPASTRLALVAAALLLGVLLAAATYGAGVWPQRPRDQREGSGFSSQVPGAVVRRAELDPSPRLCALDAQPGEPCGNLS